MDQEPIAQKVLAAIEAERQDLIDLCLALANQADYAGHELGIGADVVAWLEKAGIEAWLQHLSETSVNAVGILRGRGNRSGAGRSLILNAHMDTQGVAPKGGPEMERKVRGAWLDGDLLYGQGLANDKAQLAAEMIAMRAIKASGAQLQADLYVTGVAQETTAPVDGGLGLARRSGIGPTISQVAEGDGARWLVAHGIVADYALVGEVSDFAVSVAQAGYLRLRITVPGIVAYTPVLQRGPKPIDNPNPFERAGHVILAIEQWARTYEVEHRRDFWGGTFVPRAQVHEITSSGPAWTEARDYCYVFLDIRLVPGADPVAIQDSLRQAIVTTGLETEISAYDYRRGFIAERAEPLLDALRDAHRRVLGGDLPYAGPIVHTMWRDTNAFNEAGIPAIGYGPRTQDPIGGFAGLAGVARPITVADLLATAKVFALTALQICQLAE
jgi:acetylornithine deacetylase/succinyl-diaminopimelate desuccinylase-like protein